MLRIFIGVDDRQPLSYNVLQHSIIRYTSLPVAVTPLRISTLPITRQGLTEFTFSRYLVPWLCEYEGWGLFMDSDMLMMGDITELFAKVNDEYAVMVVKTAMRFEWPSLMMFNCAKCKMLTPDYVEHYPSPQDFGWANGKIGELPAEWNHIVAYDAYKPAKLAHYTQGVPIWFETAEGDYSKEWMENFQDMQRICAWKDIMAASVHAKPVLERMLHGYAKAQIAQQQALTQKKEAA